MRGCDSLGNGQPVSAIFTTECMRESEVRPYKCQCCGYIGEGVIRYEAKIGGSDQLVTVAACNDITACLGRVMKE